MELMSPLFPGNNLYPTTEPENMKYSSLSELLQMQVVKRIHQTSWRNTQKKHNQKEPKYLNDLVQTLYVNRILN